MATRYQRWFGLFKKLGNQAGVISGALSPGLVEISLCGEKHTPGFRRNCRFVLGEKIKNYRGPFGKDYSRPNRPLE